MLPSSASAGGGPALHGSGGGARARRRSWRSSPRCSCDVPHSDPWSRRDRATRRRRRRGHRAWGDACSTEFPTRTISARAAPVTAVEREPTREPTREEERGVRHAARLDLERGVLEHHIECCVRVERRRIPVERHIRRRFVERRRRRVERRCYRTERRCHRVHGSATAEAGGPAAGTLASLSARPSPPLHEASARGAAAARCTTA